MKCFSFDGLEKLLESSEQRTVIWMLCHYPDHVETEERAAMAARVFKKYGYPIWLFGSSNASYPEPVETMTKKKLIPLGVPDAAVRVSSDFGEIVSLDTVQEMDNVMRFARREGIERVICISNVLHLKQVHALLKTDRHRMVFVPSRLRDYRWWYIGVRLALIPCAHLGIGRDFLPLKFVRYARARWPRFGF